MRRMTARPANAHQARLLRLLRDGGPNSRAQLGDQVELSRSKLGDRPRTPLPRRRHRGHLDRRGRDQRGVGGPGAPQPPHGRARGPGRRLRASAVARRQTPGLRARGGLRRRGHRGPRPRPLPRGRAGRAADHARLGRVPGPRGAQPGAGLPGHGRQRREPHGDGGAARGRGPVRGRLPLRQDRHGHRLRHRRRRRGLPRYDRQRRGHRAHPGGPGRPGLRLWQQGLPGSPLQRRGPRPGRGGRRP